MQKVSQASGIRIVAILLAVFALPHGRAEAQTVFAQTDLGGTWRVYNVITPTVPSALVATTTGTLTFDAGGNFVSGSVASTDGTAATFTGATLIVSSTGMVTGSVASSGFVRDVTATMTARKDTITGVIIRRNTAGFRVRSGLMNLVKVTDTVFNQADVTGTWRFFTLTAPNGLPIGGNWTTGTITFDGAGNVTGGTITTPSGSGGSLSGGPITIGSTGLVSGAFASSGGAGGGAVTVQFTEASMTSDKNLVIGTFSTSASQIGLVYAVRDTGSFATADEAGTWRVSGLNTPDAFGFTKDDKATAGVVSISGTGSVSGTLVGNRHANALTGGSISINATGV